MSANPNVTNVGDSSKLTQTYCSNGSVSALESYSSCPYLPPCHSLSLEFCFWQYLPLVDPSLSCASPGKGESAFSFVYMHLFAKDNLWLSEGRIFFQGDFDVNRFRVSNCWFVSLGHPRLAQSFPADPMHGVPYSALHRYAHVLPTFVLTLML